MKVILVDDEENNMDAFEMETEGMTEIEIAGRFRDPWEALSYVKKHPVDLAVLDVEMPELDGIRLGEKMKECRPEIELIYLTAYKEYAYDAYQLYAGAYILKPFNRVDIETAFENLKRFSAKRFSDKDTPKIFIQTFGRFEVFLDGRPVEFKSARAKELLALLVDRKGGIVTTEEMLTYLWEDRPDTDTNRSLCRKVVQRLHSNLEQNGIGDIIERHTRGRSLKVDRVRCDYYEYLEGKEEGKRAFLGEYMSNYSWAEETLSRILSDTKLSQDS